MSLNIDDNENRFGSFEFALCSSELTKSYEYLVKVGLSWEIQHGWK